jgi:rhamnulokinase
MVKKLLTFDYGASSGRGILGRFDGESLQISEVHRFANEPVFAFGHYYWDVLRLFHELKQGMIKTAREGHRDIASIGVDTWGVDFALLDEDGLMLGNPFYYRDSLTNGEMERVFEVVPKKELYDRTGLQFLKFNTLFQLTAIKRTYPALLERAKTLLFMPDLLNYMLTGEKSAEFSIASTSQMLDVHKGDWDRELLEKLGIPLSILSPVLLPGQILGQTTEQIAEETGIYSLVSAVCGHDTGSAVLAVPMEKGEKAAYLSCGTWSLLGVELDSPQTSEKAFAAEYTNEGGFGKTIRFLKNIMGLWIYQEVKREYERDFGAVSYAELDAAIAKAPAFQSFIDPDAPEFMDKGQMTARIQAYCRKTNQPVPEGIGPLLRCVLESLAMKYRYAITALEDILGEKLPVLRVVGGGCKDELLLTYTANATNRQVIAGPVEATAIGNLCVQLIALTEVDGIWQARELASKSFETKTYLPRETSAWETAYGVFLEKTNLI